MSLHLKQVSGAYGASQVLWRVSLSLEDNQAVALLGRNGAGKTTLLRAIMGLHPLMSGSIELNGEDITSVPYIGPNQLGPALRFPILRDDPLFHMNQQLKIKHQRTQQ